mgnify:CR=1 FL=1
MLQTADKEAKQSGFYEGLFGIWYKRYMVIYLSIIGIQCKHDIILNIRRLLRSKMQLLKKTSIDIL